MVGQTHPIHGWVCLPDLRKLVRIAAANGQAGAAAPAAAGHVKSRE